MNKCKTGCFLLYTFLHNRIFLYLALFSGTFLAFPDLPAEPVTTAKQLSLLSPQNETATEVIPAQPQQQNLTEIEITENHGVYHINFTTIIDAPARFVRHVLTDFIHIYRLNPSIIESDVVKSHMDGSVSVRTRVIGCAAYFCEELDRVERIRQLPSGDMLAEIVPEQSEFRSGSTLWQIKSLGEQCEVNYSATMEPEIFIPPLVGNYLVEKSIKQEMQTSLANLEKISRILMEKEWHDNYQPELTAFASAYPCTSYPLNTLHRND